MTFMLRPSDPIAVMFCRALLRFCMDFRREEVDPRLCRDGVVGRESCALSSALLEGSFKGTGGAGLFGAAGLGDAKFLFVEIM